MFLVNFSLAWSFCCFFPVLYAILILSLLFYLVPILSGVSTFSNQSNNYSSFSFVQGSYLFNITFFVLFYTNVLIFNWVSPSITAWFGHLVFIGFQSKVYALLSFFFLLVVYAFSSVSYFSGREPYDFLITKINMYYWITLLFMSNSLITMIFIIEVLSALLFLLLVTSALSSVYYYRNLDFSSYNFFSSSLPSTFLQSIMYFFWVSLIGSLNLFLFVIFLYQKLFSFDWFLLEYVFYYLITYSSYKELYTLGIVWSLFLFSIFTKCGIAPFFIWKPTFFKGIPLHTILFYVCSFYFSIFLFFIYFLTSYFHFLTYYFVYILVSLVIVGLIILLTILCETFFIKTFLAVSSILNSLLILIAITSPTTVDFLFYL